MNESGLLASHNIEYYFVPALSSSAKSARESWQNIYMTNKHISITFLHRLFMLMGVT